MINRLKKIVTGLLARPLIRKSYEGVTKSVVGVAGSSRPASHVYHSLNPLPFSREEHAVLAGRRAYYENLSEPGRSMVQLRRNVHRLEKGLLMQPPRPVFALDYIDETLDFYDLAVSERSGTDVDKDELLWAEAVLTRYFERVGGAPECVTHRERFQRLTVGHNQLDDRDRAAAPDETVPYRRTIEEPPVSYDALLELSKQRRSVRWFEQRPVPRDLIDAALLIARQSPTACNRMPYEIRVFDEPDLVQAVAGLPFGAAGYAHNIPVIAVVVGRLDSYFSPRDRHAIYIDASLAAMGFMYGLETLGLSSSVINWPDFEPLERKMQKLLGLQLHERPVMLIALGYHAPDGLVAASVKKELDTFRSYNQMAGPPGADESTAS